MFNEKPIAILKRAHQRINGSKTEFNLKPYKKLLADIKTIGSIYEKTDTAKLKPICINLTTRARNGEQLDELLVETFALVREIIRRELKLDPFDGQIIGGIVMHQGKLAEMQTGEGKTLMAVFPACLNALAGNGVHILTYNDYLARRDAQWMDPIYQFFGLKTGIIQERMKTRERKGAYAADITYLTAKEAGFDYLRDSFSDHKKDQVQRVFQFAIIDEADSILIDEARVPLIIAGSSESVISNTFRMAPIIRELKPGLDVELDEAARNAFLNDSGLEKVEKSLKCENLYAVENIDLLTQVHCAVHAEFLLQRDVDYIVRNGKIELVDELTGRIADNRRWPDGIQAALEAKEQITAHQSGKILNSITLHHYIQLYPKISGMTATAQPAEEELWHLYDLKIAVIPTHKPCIRIDQDDLIFKTKSEKQKALVREIISVNQTRRPILVGTRSVEESALLAEVLRQHDVSCEVLNAKRDELEADIIARAGELDAVTISTNMAGRGIDIHLGNKNEKEKKEVMDLGGLYVIGTNKHESRRIDKQLRGRSGRQGDPGSSRFFVSLEDDLFVKYNIQNLIPEKHIITDSTSILKNRFVRKEINRLQRVIEAQHLEIKNSLNTYSAIIEKQRQLISDQRLSWMEDTSTTAFFQARAPQQFLEKQSFLGDDQLKSLCRKLLTRSVDAHWSEYLANIAEIREGIHLRSYAAQGIAGQSPYVEFQKIAVKLFREMLEKLETEAILLFKEFTPGSDTMENLNQKLKRPSSTWTYLINDDPFDNAGNLGKSIALAYHMVLFSPVMIIYMLYVKLKNRFGAKKD